MSEELKEKLRKELRVFQDYTASWGYPMNSEVHRTGLDKAEAKLLELFESYAKERELKGEFKCFDWIVRHDESSFRQERSWFKVKPRLLLERQAQITRELESQKEDI